MMGFQSARVLYSPAVPSPRTAPADALQSAISAMAVLFLQDNRSLFQSVWRVHHQCDDGEAGCEYDGIDDEAHSEPIVHQHRNSTARKTCWFALRWSGRFFV